jgi:peptidyl-prolyl cis-trans isomerase SurA
MTPIMTMISKFFNNKNTILAFALFFALNTIAQVKPKKQKVDGVAAVVGDFIVLDSDIDLMLIDLKSQGIDTKDLTRCELLGKQLEDKLYAHQAIQDSIKVTDEEVTKFLNQQFGVMVDQLGSKEKVFEQYKKKNEEDFRTYFFDVIKMNKLTSQMQRKVTENVTVTPDEVNAYFSKLPKDKIPTVPAEVEFSQITVKPVISAAEKQVVIDKLKEIRKDVLDGTSSFTTKAVIYSEDGGSSSNGGFYKINKKTQFVKEFKDTAFRMAEGEISEPFETDFGYHIIQMEKIKGQELELRHIVMSAKPSAAAIVDAQKKLEDIRQKIQKGEITFADAAKASSDDKETRTNGGIVINPQTSELQFEIAKLDPKLYGQLNPLNAGDMSMVLLDQERAGAKFFKLLKVNKKTTEHTADFTTDYIKIKELALNDKQFKEVSRWFEETIQKTYININTDYKDCEFSSNWLKKQQ